MPIQATPTQLHQLTALQLSKLYRERKLSPVEVTEEVLHHIETYEHQVNAFALLDAESALSDARASEKRWSEGTPRSDLDGVPAAVKDNLWVKGWPTLSGSRAVDPDQSWEEDCAAAARLRECGSVLLGKTTTSEFAASTYADSPLTGITRNPWNLRHTAGGSSGGSAAAAALGFGPLHVATDGGGSTRVPSSYSGLFGFKASYGRVSTYPSARQTATFHVTPMTRTVSDTALLLNVLTKPDWRDFNSFPDDSRDWLATLDQGVKGLRIGFSRNLGYVDVDPEVARLVERAVKVFEELGATVEIVDPGFHDPIKIFRTLSRSTAAHMFGQISPDRQSMASQEYLEIVRLGREIDAVAYLQAAEQREILGRTMSTFHQKWDLLLTPATPVVAPLADYLKGHPGSWTLSPFAYPFNLTKHPAASVPIGFTGQGLPAGLQIVAPRLRDDLVLRAARSYEAVHPFATTAAVG